MDEAIEEFLSQRKADRIKKKLKPGTPVHEKTLIEQDAAKEFSPETWLPKAAKRARQLSLVSHPAKFSHPGAKSKLIIFNGNYEADGFLRSGNAHVELDVLGSASAMDVFKFLSLHLNDGKTILEHLELESEKIKNDLHIASVSFDELRNGFSAIKDCADKELTDPKIKQVYFPIKDGKEGYHLLSILSPSGLIYSLRKKIHNLRFSDETKKARDDRKKQVHNEAGFDDLSDLAMIGYGGTKPQNISVLNSANGGKAYLLPSFPPTLNEQYLRLPHNDFFTDSLWRKNFIDEFQALHKIFSADYNNKNIRDGRDEWLQSIVDKVVNNMWTLRSAEPGWSAKDNCRLSEYQKIWLDNVYKEKCEEGIDTDWLDEVMSNFARWIIFTYEKVIGKKAKILNDKDLEHIKKLIEQNVEGLK